MKRFIILCMLVAGCASLPSSISLNQLWDKALPINLSSFMNNLKRNMAFICLTGEGKGKLSSQRGSFTFAYESRSELQKWLFSLMAPGTGEELLEVSWTPAFPGEVEFKGSFFDRMVENWMNQTHASREDLKQSLIPLAMFFRFQEDMVMGANNHFSCAARGLEDQQIGKCTTAGLAAPFFVTLQPHDFLLQYKDAEQTISWKLWRGQKEVWGRWNILIEGANRPKIYLQLAASECVLKK